MSVLSSSVAPAVGVTSRADWRRYWRVLLAVVAPIPGIALALSNAITPGDLGGSARETLAAVAADPGAAKAASVFSIVFLVLLVPSGVAMVMALRRTMPRAATLVGGFVLLGFCSG